MSDKQDFQLLVDPALNQGCVKLYRYNGCIPGHEVPVEVYDPRPRSSFYQSDRRQQDFDLGLCKFRNDQNSVQRPANNAEVTFTNLHADVTRAYLKELCVVFGPVNEVKVYVNENIGRPLGVGKVVFAGQKPALDCVSRLAGSSHFGLPIGAFVDQHGRRRAAIVKDLLRRGESFSCSHEQFDPFAIDFTDLTVQAATTAPKPPPEPPVETGPRPPAIPPTDPPPPVPPPPEPQPVVVSETTNYFPSRVKEETFELAEVSVVGPTSSHVQTGAVGGAAGETAAGNLAVNSSSTFHGFAQSEHRPTAATQNYYQMMANFNVNWPGSMQNFFGFGGNANVVMNNFISMFNHMMERNSQTSTDLPTVTPQQEEFEKAIKTYMHEVQMQRISFTPECMFSFVNSFVSRVPNTGRPFGVPGFMGAGFQSKGPLTTWTDLVGGDDDDDGEPAETVVSTSVNLRDSRMSSDDGFNHHESLESRIESLLQGSSLFGGDVGQAHSMVSQPPTAVNTPPTEPVGSQWKRTETVDPVMARTSRWGPPKDEGQSYSTVSAGYDRPAQERSSEVEPKERGSSSSTTAPTTSGQPLRKTTWRIINPIADRVGSQVLNELFEQLSNDLQKNVVEPVTVGYLDIWWQRESESFRRKQLLAGSSGGRPEPPRMVPRADLKTPAGGGLLGVKTLASLPSFRRVESVNPDAKSSTTGERDERQRDRQERSLSSNVTSSSRRNDCRNGRFRHDERRKKPEKHRSKVISDDLDEGRARLDGLSEQPTKTLEDDDRGDGDDDDDDDDDDNDDGDDVPPVDVSRGKRLKKNWPKKPTESRKKSSQNRADKRLTLANLYLSSSSSLSSDDEDDDGVGSISGGIGGVGGDYADDDEVQTGKEQSQRISTSSDDENQSEFSESTTAATAELNINNEMEKEDSETSLSVNEDDDSDEGIAFLDSSSRMGRKTEKTKSTKERRKQKQAPKTTTKKRRPIAPVAAPSSSSSAGGSDEDDVGCSDGGSLPLDDQDEKEKPSKSKDDSTKTEGNQQETTSSSPAPPPSPSPPSPKPLKALQKNKLKRPTAAKTTGRAGRAKKRAHSPVVEQKDASEDEPPLILGMDMNVDEDRGIPLPPAHHLTVVRQTSSSPAKISPPSEFVLPKQDLKKKSSSRCADYIDHETNEWRTSLSTAASVSARRTPVTADLTTSTTIWNNIANGQEAVFDVCRLVGREEDVENSQENSAPFSSSRQDFFDHNYCSPMEKWPSVLPSIEAFLCQRQTVYSERLEAAKAARLGKPKRQEKINRELLNLLEPVTVRRLANGTAAPAGQPDDKRTHHGDDGDVDRVTSDQLVTARFDPRSAERERTILMAFEQLGLDAEDMGYLKEVFEEEKKAGATWLEDVNLLDETPGFVADRIPGTADGSSPKRRKTQWTNRTEPASLDEVLSDVAQLALLPDEPLRTAVADQLDALWVKRGHRQPRVPHKTGCARTEGWYKVESKDVASLSTSDLPLPVEGADSSQNDCIQLKTASTRSSREARKVNRGVLSALAQSGFTLVDSDLLKLNQFAFRKKLLKFNKSPIHGWGLYALERIGAEEMVVEYVGQLIRTSVAEVREKRYIADGEDSSYLFRVDGELVIDATRHGNLARFINHSCNPNCYAKVVTIGKQKKIVIFSKKEIEAGEEITYDYKFPYEDNKIPCYCGSQGCRNYLN